MSKSRWREYASPIIARIVRTYPDGPERRAELRKAYPFGERKYHPYKIWLDEIARQTGKKKPSASRVESRIMPDQHTLI